MNKTDIIWTEKTWNPMPYAAIIHTLAWTGMRPSETCGLRKGDLDLATAIVRVCRARHSCEDGPTKTGSAVRTVQLVPQTVEWLRRIQPLHVRPEDFVFTNTDHRPVEPRKLAERFHDCLRALGIRPRGVYALKDTYISIALSKGVEIAWLEAQTGVGYATIRRHYGQYVRTAGADQIARLTGGESLSRIRAETPR